jgi:type II secretory pathway pseudopilin PulG
MKDLKDLATNRRGITLLAAMILLIVMSLLGVVAVNLAVQETKIAQNYEGSRVALTWAEAGIQAARQVIVESTNPDMPGYSCDPTDPDTYHYYPSDADRRVRYCIELLKMELSGENDNRGSGQDATRGTRSYYYKLDSFVLRTADNGEEVVLRQVQTLEQQSRYSI